ncbi:MAG TPA: response regulator, partial [Myxococcaceae bacterium]|nr:response regulator [Myxococcaceae bacterium]
MFPPPTNATAAPSHAASTARAVSAAAARRRPLKATDTVSSVRPLILAVEPDARTRSLLEVGFAEQGFTLVTAASAEEAQGYLRPEWILPSMIFCEADLRGLDGFTLCGQIRADTRTTDLPVVLLSKTPDEFHREMAGGAGADQLLPKPLFLNDLLAMARLMAGRGSAGGRYEADTSELPLLQVLRALLSGVRSGRLDFHPGPAWISFGDGQAVDAAYEGLRGDEALRRMLLLARGKYVVTFGPTLSAATMTFGVEELCGPAYARVQRWEELTQVGLSLEAVWAVDFGALDMALPGLAQEVAALVHAFDGKRTVRDVLMKSSMDELLALEAVGRLVGMGVLVPQDRGADATQGASRVRALFQPPPAAEQEGESQEMASVAEGGTGEDAPTTSLYESTGTLDKSILQQLAAFRIRPVVENDEPAQREQAPEESFQESIAGAIEAAIGEIAAAAPEPRGEQQEIESLARALDAELAEEETHAASPGEEPPVAAIPGAAVEATADDRPEARWFEESAAEQPTVAAVAEAEPEETPREEMRALEERALVVPPLASMVAWPSLAEEPSALDEGAALAPPAATV